MERTNPKAFIFVLMPFSEEFRDIYEVGIKAACKDAGAYCERVDEQQFDERILERVYNQIAKADVIVADMTGRNPNVFYEVGYAHALNKRVILLTQDGSDIPFDLVPYTHIIYKGSISYLKSQLETTIKWCIENPKDSLLQVNISLDVYVNRVAIVDQTEVWVRFRSGQIPFEFETELRIDIHNITDRLISAESYKLCLLIPGFLEVDPMNSEHVRLITHLPDGNAIYNLKQPDSFFPGSWAATKVVLKVDEDDLTKKLPVKMCLRLFTELGPKDYEFLLSHPAF